MNCFLATWNLSMTVLTVFPNRPECKTEASRSNGPRISAWRSGKSGRFLWGCWLRPLDRKQTSSVLLLTSLFSSGHSILSLSTGWVTTSKSSSNAQFNCADDKWVALTASESPPSSSEQEAAESRSSSGPIKIPDPERSSRILANEKEKGQSPFQTH